MNIELLKSIGEHPSVKEILRESPATMCGTELQDYRKHSEA
jgi:hypothetical protein